MQHSLFLTALVASQISFVLREATILDRPRRLFTRSKVLEYLLSCKLCLNFWPSLLLTIIEIYLQQESLLAGFYSLFAVWALAYMIDAARAKYLPCDACTKQGDISVGSYQVIS